MIRNIVILSLLICSVTQSVLAQITTPKYSNEFLAIGVGANSLAKAGAVSAIVSDVTAGYWNPAGLNSIDTDYDIALMHTEYYAGIAQYDYIGFATKLDDKSKFAISMIRFGIDDIPDTRFLYDANGSINYDNIRFFSSADYAFLFSYARRVDWLNGLDVGGNVKVIHRIAGNFANSWGFGLDFGAQMTVNKWKFGAVLKDAFGTFNIWNHNLELVADIYQQTGNTLPENAIELTVPKLTLGIARPITIKEKWEVLPSIDFDITMDGKRNTLIKTDFISIDPKFGLEISYLKKGFIRAGIGNIQQTITFDGTQEWQMQPNFGIGAKLKQFAVDYALLNPIENAVGSSSHAFSVRVFFNAQKKIETNE